MSKPINADNIREVPGTRYIIINGDTVARLLTPTVNKANGRRYYNLIIKGDYVRIDANDLGRLFDKKEETK